MDAVEVDDDAHLVAQLVLSFGLLFGHLLESAVDHYQDVGDSYLIFLVFLH